MAIETIRKNIMKTIDPWKSVLFFDNNHFYQKNKTDFHGSKLTFMCVFFFIACIPGPDKIETGPNCRHQLSKTKRIMIIDSLSPKLWGKKNKNNTDELNNSSSLEFSKKQEDSALNLEDFFMVLCQYDLHLKLRGQNFLIS